MTFKPPLGIELLFNNYTVEVTETSPGYSVAIYRADGSAFTGEIHYQGIDGHAFVQDGFCGRRTAKEIAGMLICLAHDENIVDYNDDVEGD